MLQALSNLSYGKAAAKAASCNESFVSWELLINYFTWEDLAEVARRGMLNTTIQIIYIVPTHNKCHFQAMYKTQKSSL